MSWKLAGIKTTQSLVRTLVSVEFRPPYRSVSVPVYGLHLTDASAKLFF